jgi:opacity protein-like surface antigen
MSHWLRFTLIPVVAAVASAQVFEVGLNGGVSTINGKTLGQLGTSSLTLDDGWRFGFRMTLNNWRFLGHEFGYSYVRTKLGFVDPAGTVEAGMAVHQGFYNFLVYALPEGQRVRPFVTGGVGFNNFTPPGTSVTSGGGSTKYGVNYGGGIKAKLTDKLLFRVDLREYLCGKPFDLPSASGKIRLLEISAGLSFHM